MLSEKNSRLYLVRKNHKTNLVETIPHNYNYAYSSSSRLIHISDAQRGENYYCPECNELMTPHMGQQRRWHFVHKNAGNCSYESYLHKLAKIKIRQAFLSSDSFILSYKARAVCSHKCPFISSPICEVEKPVEFNLRRFYDTCEVEASYKDFRADLLLKSSANPDRPPVLIEIMVTHKCTEDKIKDGVRIIEIPIQSEEQIDNIVKSCKLAAERYIQLSYNDFSKSVIAIYNFNKTESFDPTEICNEYEDYFSQKNTYLYWINENGHFHAINCHCYEVSKKLPPNVHSYITTTGAPFKEILQGFSKRGVKIRNCFLCKFSQLDNWDNRICVLYKRYNMPRKPSPYSALTCPHYREDFDCPQNSEPIDQLSHTEQAYYPTNKSYFQICNDIL